VSDFCHTGRLKYLAGLDMSLIMVHIYRLSDLDLSDFDFSDLEMDFVARA